MMAAMVKAALAAICVFTLSATVYLSASLLIPVSYTHLTLPTIYSV